MNSETDSSTRLSEQIDVGVELSLYPLDRDYIPPIKALIERLNADPRFRVTTNSMSTQIFGAYDELLPFLARELRPVFATHGTAVVVMKLLGPLSRV